MSAIIKLSLAGIAALALASSVQWVSEKVQAVSNLPIEGKLVTSATMELKPVPSHLKNLVLISTQTASEGSVQLPNGDVVLGSVFQGQGAGLNRKLVQAPGARIPVPTHSPLVVQAPSVAAVTDAGLITNAGFIAFGQSVTDGYGYEWRAVGTVHDYKIQRLNK